MSTRRDERGVVMVMTALSFLALLALAALVVDAGGLYVVRRADQEVADFAARAALPNLPGSPLAACGAAWDYVEANLALPSGATSPCGPTFPTSCTSATTPTNYTASGTGAYTITFHYPVGDTEISPLQANDGTQCERIKVTVLVSRPSFFAGIIGSGTDTARSSAVGRRAPSGSEAGISDLVVLDPTGCEALTSSGNSSIQAGTSNAPGLISLDSDGSVCTSGQYTIDTNGGGTISAVPTSGDTPGYIRLYALPAGATSCSGDACSASEVSAGSIAPQPSPLPARITRAFVDYHYNCKASYPTYHGITIPGCTLGTSPYIDNLVAAIGSSGAPDATYTQVTNCGSSSQTFAPGNYWLDCPGGINIGNNVTLDFKGGNLVIDGSASITTGGALIVNDQNPKSSLPGSCESAVCIDSSSTNAAFVYQRSGGITRSGGSLELDNTMLYVASGLVAAAGSYKTGDSVAFNAPTEGPFSNLALWDQTSGADSLQGGGQLSVEGVFFTPEATPFEIYGGSGSQQYDGQFVSYHFEAGGGASFALNPNPNRTITTGGATTTGFFLIR